MPLKESQRREFNEHVNEVFICIRLCYSFCHWINIVEPLLEQTGIYEGIHQYLPDIKYSCFMSCVANIRKYDEFLFPRNEQTTPDDIRASDFPDFRTSQSVLTAEERIDINKRLMHLTDRQINEGNWNIAVREMLPKIAECQKEFTAYVKTNWPRDSAKHVDASSVEAMIDMCLAFIRDEAAP